MVKALTLALCLMTHGLATPALADLVPSDGIATSGPLTDAEFLRLATCGATPDSDCLSPVLRWDKPRLTLRIGSSKGDTPSGFEARLMPAVRNAINEVNAVGAGVSISFTNAPVADITVLATPLGEGTELGEEPGFSGPGVMGVGYMTVWSDERNRIVEAVILISTTITDSDLTSVVLEEVTQSLGFLYDIENPDYEGVSILSQTSNTTTRLAGQDAAILRLHYPAKP
ncbi:MAG: hypothetical protein C0524_03935 [Rhodobacter sp.]|nr:hypothetical protein [Rhodobacter sp.]